MKKCSKCKIVFHLDERSRCLYCNSLLLTVSRDDTVGLNDDLTAAESMFKSDQPVINQILKDRAINEVGRRAFIIGCYFRSRTFKFMYSFSRHEFIMEKSFKRVLAQPLNISSFLMLPWVAFNILDTLFVRFYYNGFCPKCKWKFKQFSENQQHDPEGCDYNREYSKIIDDILSGEISKSELALKQYGEAKEKAGRKSAYQVLCEEKDFLQGMLDVLCIWVSIGILIILLVITVFPLISWIVNSISVEF